MDRKEESAPIRRIVLTGFMGSGKSTVGPLLAGRLGWRFVDLDDMIVAETGMPITDFFARYGEAAFREREYAVIARLGGENALVLALGGGAIETAATRELLLNSAGTMLVHLDVKLETTLARCRGTEDIRPVLADQPNLRARYERRLPFYRMAHFSITADEITPEGVVDAIVRAAAVHAG
jgi:shikimate kinase